MIAPVPHPSLPESEALQELLPGFVCIDHVALTVPPGSLEAYVQLYTQLGLKECHREEAQGADRVREVMLQIGDGPHHGGLRSDSPSCLQLLEPLDASSTVQRALDRSGGKSALHHIALRVEDAQKAYQVLQERGFRMIDPAPRRGTGGSTVFFIHPKSPDPARPQSLERQPAEAPPNALLQSTPLNVLIEIVQENEAH